MMHFAYETKDAHFLKDNKDIKDNDMKRIRMRIIFRYPSPYPLRISKAIILGSKDKTKDINTNTFYQQITRIITN